ncbi:MAG: class I SAM-dependent methyltransferase [Hyphomicrobiales bacterium]|nr:class I SAM-dependent methyltransferase [Hyphomicrobiales bacterium]
MDKEKIKDFADHVYRDMAGAMSVGMAYVGTKLGLFEAMSGAGGLSVDEVVGRTGLDGRYVREWLFGMVAAGYLEYDPEVETFRLPEEHAYLLASEGTDHFMGGLFYMAPVLLGIAPKVAEAFRNGGGVQFADFGSECVVGLDMINRGQYEQRLSTYWLQSMPEVVEKLNNGGRVLDVGCGVGRVAIAIAKAFPDAHVVGLDPDEESIRRAREAATEAGIADNIEFVAAVTCELQSAEPFDLVTAFDCVHDFSMPQQTLTEIKSLLHPAGTLFIVEPKAADRLEDNVHSLGAVYYGFSIFHCMTQSLADGGPGLGTCMGPEMTATLIREAGFGRFERLEIRSQTNLFYAVGH